MLSPIRLGCTEYWIEVDLLPNETTTTQERESVNERGIDSCSYPGTYTKKKVTLEIK